METINLQIVREDLPPTTFSSVQTRNLRLSNLIAALWVNEDFDLAIWRPAENSSRLQGHWAIATVIRGS